MKSIDKLYLEPGDIIFIKNKTWVHRIIAWATQRPSEPITKASHVLMAVNDKMLIEALSIVKLRHIPGWINKHNNFEIWRSQLDTNKKLDITETSLQYKQKEYGWWKIVGHAGDSILTKLFDREIVFFRKFIGDNHDYPICSWLVAYSYYDAIGYDFGVSYKYAAPDDIYDHVVKSNDWFCIFSKDFGTQTF